MAEEKEIRIPRCREIPDVGLYLDQTVKYINRSLEPVHCAEITASMVSNYVKQGYIRNPVKKQYDGEQIARLMLIAMIKNVLSMENIGRLVQIMESTMPFAEGYDRFCVSMEEQLRHLYLEEPIPERQTDPEMILLRSVVAATANVLYLNHQLEELKLPAEGE